MIYSIGVQSLSVPKNLPTGGMAGYIIIINYLTNAPISLLTLLFNIPLLIAAYFFLGKNLTFKTAKTVLILTISLEFANRFVPVFHGDIMLTAIVAGVLKGIGLGIILLRGSTTGGTDIVSLLFQRKMPHISTGRLLFMLNASPLLLSVFVYGGINNAMYSLILVFVSSKIIDAIVYGAEKGRMLMIITEKYQEIAAAIHTEMSRGSTMLKGMGTYTGEERPVLLCAISLAEFSRLKNLIYTHDPTAFVMSMVTDEIFGKGFTPFDEKEGEPKNPEINAP